MSKSKVGAVKDAKMYAEWNREHDRCMTCGRDEVEAARECWPGLTTHHIEKFKRSDERCNLIRLCTRCHNIAEGHLILEQGTRLPPLTMGVILWVKRRLEPADHCPERLTVLRGRPLPEEKPIPEFYLMEMERFCPEMTRLFRSNL